MSSTDTGTKATKKTELPVFVTVENRSKLMAIYGEALRHWPVPFETSFVASRYGKTHVIASGNPASPPQAHSRSDRRKPPISFPAATRSCTVARPSTR